MISERLNSYTHNFNKIKEKQPQINEEIKVNSNRGFLIWRKNAIPTRLEQECAFLLQKTDVAEELDRINYHLESLNSILIAGGIVGRKLGFILQEVQGN